MLIANFEVYVPKTPVFKMEKILKSPMRKPPCGKTPTHLYRQLGESLEKHAVEAVLGVL